MASSIVPTIVREFAKNRREIVRACLSEYEGRPVADVRVWMPRRADGVLVPSIKGLTIDRGLLPALEDAVHALRLAAAPTTATDAR